MGLKRIVGIRQFTGVTPGGKMAKFYRVTFETDKTDGEFTFDVPRDEYDPAVATVMAKEKAEAIDAAIGPLRTPPTPP